MTKRTNAQQDAALDQQQAALNAQATTNSNQATNNAAQQTQIDNLTAAIGLNAPDGTTVDTTRGALQRLRIHVPTPGGESQGSTLTMGYQLADTTYTGFGLQTYGHVFVNAKGGVGASKMTLQANGQVVLRSDGEQLFAIAKGASLVASEDTAYMAGAKGLLLAAGTAPTASNQPKSGDAPPPPPEGQQFIGALSSVNQMWAAADAMVASLVALRAAAAIKADPKSVATLDGIVGIVSNSAGLAGMANSWAGAFGGSLYDGSVSMYGKTGVLIGSPISTTVYGGLGLMLASLAPSVTGVSSEVLGVTSAKLSSYMTATVWGGRTAELYGGREVKIGARTQKLEVDAPTIEIGHHTATPPQLPTNEIHAKTLQKYTVHSKGAGADAIDFKAENGTVGAHGKERVVLDSDKKVDIHVGSFVIEVLTDKIKIGKAGGSGRGASPSDPFIEITASEIKIANTTNGMRVTKSMTAIGTQQNYVSVNKSGTINYKGTLHKMG